MIDCRRQRAGKKLQALGAGITTIAAGRTGDRGAYRTGLGGQLVSHLLLLVVAIKLR